MTEEFIKKYNQNFIPRKEVELQWKKEREERDKRLKLRHKQRAEIVRKNGLSFRKFSIDCKNIGQFEDILKELVVIGYEQATHDNTSYIIFNEETEDIQYSVEFVDNFWLTYTNKGE